ncbi:calcium-binding protein [Pseudomonas japonica]|uniref:calcium-binding protein n=1 Tax=Pseudomonas japonica TaxID=256466 RepID=UPI0015E48561|nr:calcium-binding protein [Pseudomonas japonica]MBA1244301.1 calcium-binding protein [Pseudomonas japonica]
MATYKNTVYWYGTPGNDAIVDVFGVRNVMYGGTGDDELNGGFSSDSVSVLIGGSGRDELNAISAVNILRFNSVTDSYRDATTGHWDYVYNFDTTRDKLDLTALGYTGIGDGHGSTLKVMYNETTDTTYLKSFDADASGQRFELGFGGHDYAFSDANFVALLAGTSHADQLTGSDQAATLAGYEGRDTLVGGSADERLDGGTGGDTLTGGTGADAFVFHSIGDSVRADGPGGTGGRDLIADFSAAEGDTVDLSSLGFTGFGNGLNGTLKVSVNAAGDKTALKSPETDSAGNHFEVFFNGNLAGDLNRDTVIFANTTGDKVINTLTRDDQETVGTDKGETIVGGDARDEILGFAGNDRINGGTGDDSMAGGKGADTLTGGEGRDDFVFYSIEESYRTATADHSDTITDYEKGDILYALDLGFDDLGDGTGRTLALDYDRATDKTLLHSLEADDQGRYFQITLAGEHTTVSIALDGLYVDEQPISILGVDPHGPAPV